MSGPRKAPPKAVDDAIHALKKRKGIPTESDRPRQSTFPGRRIRPIPGQLDLGGKRGEAVTTTATAGAGTAPVSAWDTLPLLPQHVELLMGSGIDHEVARVRGYMSATAAKTLAQLRFSGRQASLLPALAIPFWSATGEIAFWQSRPDRPRLFPGREGSRKLVKYETPVGARMAVDVHPIVRPKISDPSVPLLVTEGVRKADALVSRGHVAVALAGIWNWRGTNDLNGLTVLADWEWIALNDREVVVVFDNDVLRNPLNRKALDRLTGFLELRHANVRVARLPERLP